MQPGSKRFGRNLVGTLSNVEMKSKEQHDCDRKVQESVDNLIRQTIAGKEPLFSLTKSGDSPLQWIHLLDSWDQQNGGKVSTSSKVDPGTDAKSNKQAESRRSDSIGNINSVKSSVHSGMKNGGVFGRGLQAAGECLHSLKIPEAVVAFAQAAAKANDLPGLSLVPPSKTQLQKCDKCVLEFCSPLNYRRHIRMHRRPLNVDKEDLRKVRPQVAAFWDKLTADEAGQIVSLNNMIFEDLSGASIVKALSGFLQKSDTSFVHRSCLKAGTTLLEIVQNKLSKFPLSAEELFNALDDSSEKTFLCGVLSVSMKRFIFEGAAGKVGMEARNLVAALGFLVEQRLIKAWMAERDEEALRCQKALVEEEEAAQKKHAKMQERKQLKKIRQKELKEKESKGTESGLKGLEIDLVDRGSGLSQTELDDSPSVLQSSSSVYSGQDQHLEPSTMDFGMFDEHESMPFKSVEQESSQFVEQTFCLINERLNRENTLELDSTSNGQAVQDEIQLHQRNEDLKSFVPVRSGNLASEQRINHAWRERRHETYEFANYQRPFYGSNIQFSDIKYRQAQRTARKPYNVPLDEMHDYSSLSSVNELYMVTRSKQYHDRSLGVRKHAAIVRSAHAVWARKAQQNAMPQPENADFLVDASKSSEAVVNTSVLHDELPHVEKGRVPAENENIPCIGGKSCDIVPNSSSNSNTWSMNCEKSNRALNDDRIDSGLSRDSSISFDCVSCRSLDSLSEKGAEEESQDTEVGKINAAADVCETSCLSRESSEVNSSNGALFIGSLSIPIQVFSNLKCEGNPHENLKRSSRDIQHSPGKKQKGEPAASFTSPCIVAGGEKKRSQTKTMVSACEISKEGNNTNNQASVGQVYDCEDAAGLSKTISVHDKINDPVPSVNEGSEICTVKVWRPGIGAGEWHQVHNLDSACVKNEDLLIDRTGKGKTCPLMVVKNVKIKLSGYPLSLKGSIGDQQEEYDMVKMSEGQLPIASRFGGSSVEHETAVISTGSTDISLSLKLMEKMPLAGSDKWESLSRCVASFLSRRWVDAIAAVEG